MTRRQMIVAGAWILALLILVSALYFGLPAIYNSGYAKGRKEALAETPSVATTTVTESVTGNTLASLTDLADTGAPAASGSSDQISSVGPTTSTTVTPEGPQTASILEHGILLPDDVYPLDVFLRSGSSNSFVKTGDNSQVLDFGLTGSLYLCEGNYVAKSTSITDSVNASWLEQYGNGQGWGTELTSYQPDQSKASLDSVWAKANDCPKTLPNRIDALGDDAFRLTSQSGSGSSTFYHEEIFIRLKDVVIQVGLTTKAGDHGVSAEALARLAVAKYLKPR